MEIAASHMGKRPRQMSSQMKTTSSIFKKLLLATLLTGSFASFAQSQDWDEDKSGAVIMLKKRVEAVLANEKPVAPPAQQTTIQLSKQAATATESIAVAAAPAPTKTQIAIPVAQPKTLLIKTKAEPAPKQAPVVAKAPRIDLEASVGAVAPPIKVRSMDLPGLGPLPGDPGDYKIKSVRVGSDRNELVYISISQPNKIATPFDRPQVTFDETRAVGSVVGQDFFIQPNSENPITAYISNGGVGQSVGITLVPRANLPAQSIVLQPDSTVTPGVAKADEQENVAGDYVSRINSLIKQLALGKTPNGFNKSAIPRTVISSPQLVIEPQNKFSGATFDLFSYRVRSISASPIEMREDSFYTDVVRAIAFYPTAVLQAGEETMVYVIADRLTKDAVK
jgi:conjugal transfer pilus assembly protein TraK